MSARKILAALTVAAGLAGIGSLAWAQLAPPVTLEPAVGSSDLIPIVPNGAPTGYQQYTTPPLLSAYVRGVGAGSWEANIIENPDFLIDTVNAGASVTTGTSLARAIDRWYAIYTVSSSGGTAWTTQQVALSAGLTLTTDELKITGSATKTTSATAGMISYIQQTVEAADMEDLQWGQTAVAGQQQPTPVTVSLWLKSSIASANIGVALKGASTVQSYVNNCVLSSTASTWTQCIFTIPAPTTGTWTGAVGSAGPVLTVAVQCGTTFQTTAGSWQTGGPYYCTSAQTQQLATASSTLEVAAVKMQRGTSATAFGPPPVPISQAILRRYLQTSFALGTAPANNSTYAGSQCFNAASATSGANSVMVQLSPPMYAAPTITLYSPGATGTGTFYDFTGSATVTATTDPATAKGTAGFEVATGAGTTAAHVLCVQWLADAGI
jgi:hypothetical protein